MKKPLRDRIHKGEFQNPIVYTDPSICGESYRRWYDSERDCLERFREAAIQSVGLNNNPKADQAYAVAWERAEDTGLEGVLSLLEELAKLVRAEPIKIQLVAEATYFLAEVDGIEEKAGGLNWIEALGDVMFRFQDLFNVKVYGAPS